MLLLHAVNSDVFLRHVEAWSACIPDAAEWFAFFVRCLRRRHADILSRLSKAACHARADTLMRHCPPYAIKRSFMFRPPVAAMRVVDTRYAVRALRYGAMSRDDTPRYFSPPR